MALKNNLIYHLSYLPGWRTNRKIVVFESDDWGSIRMPSREAYDYLRIKGVDVNSGDSLRYNRYDTLASCDDLISLFETLDCVRDKNGNSAVFTALSLVANPDFEKIREHNFVEYFYEPFTETLKKYGRDDAFQMWREGVNKRLFIPQFHGREHLNVKLWMRSLQDKNTHTRFAFDQGMWGIRVSESTSFQAAFDLCLQEDLEYQKLVIEEGLLLFKRLHGYKASFFVPPNGPFNSSLEETAYLNGIMFISTSKIHFEPQGNGQYKRRFYWLGKRNRFNQRYITRNAFFEPSLKGKDWVDCCLKDISIAFKYHKPATVSTHRVNYIGTIDPVNRINGLSQLKLLLKAIVKKWPEVEFMTADELGVLISDKKNGQ